MTTRYSTKQIKYEVFSNIILVLLVLYAFTVIFQAVLIQSKASSAFPSMYYIQKIMIHHLLICYVALNDRFRRTAEILNAIVFVKLEGFFNFTNPKEL